MSKVIKLPEKLDTSAASWLLGELNDSKGYPLVLDASNTNMIGALCANILVSAAEKWRAEGEGFQLLGLGGVENDLILLGLAEFFDAKEAIV